MKRQVSYVILVFGLIFTGHCSHGLKLPILRLLANDLKEPCLATLIQFSLHTDESDIAITSAICFSRMPAPNVALFDGIEKVSFEYIRHPDLYKYGVLNEIGVLKLEKKIKFPSEYTRVQLPNQFEYIKIGDHGITAEDHTESVQSELEVVKSDHCPEHKEKLFCANFTENQTETVKAGSPFLTFGQDPSIFLLHGVAGNFHKDVFTRISQFRPADYRMQQRTGGPNVIQVLRDFFKNLFPSKKFYSGRTAFIMEIGVNRSSVPLM